MEQNRYNVYWKSQSGSNAYLIFDVTANRIINSNMSKESAATLYKSLMEESGAGPMSLKSAKEVVSAAHQVNEVYEPSRGNMLKIYKEEQIHLINTYEPPQWMKGGRRPQSGNVQKYVMPFMNHLFNGDEQVIEHVLDWMAVMVQGQRNEVILCLIGEQGVGKGLFGDLCRSLVGPSYQHESPNGNWAKISTNTFSGTHNGELKNRMFIHFEEAYVGRGIEQQKVMNNIKRLNSDTIYMRSMYRDATSVRNFASLMLCSNHFAAIPAERGQRRFWTVGITKTKIQNSKLIFDAMFDNQRHATIAAAIKDTLLAPVTIRELGALLLERKAKLLLSPPDIGDRSDEISNMWDAQPNAYKAIFEYHKLRSLETGAELGHREFERILQEAVPRYGQSAYQVTQDVVLDVIYYSALYHKYILAKHPVPALELHERPDKTYSVRVTAGVPKDILDSLKGEMDEQRQSQGKIADLTKQRRSNK